MASIESTQTGDWDETTTWVGGVVPVSGDSVTIKAGHTVTIDSEVACLDLTVEATATLSFDGDALAGACGVTFDDDASASLTNNGTISSTNTTATDFCYIYGGSTTNKVDWDTVGTYSNLDFCKWKFADFSDSSNVTLPANTFWWFTNDMDIDTFLVGLGESLIIEPVAPMTITIGNSDEDNVDYIDVRGGLFANGTSTNTITITGNAADHRMKYGINLAANNPTVQLNYVTISNVGTYGIWGGNGYVSASNCTIDGSTGTAAVGGAGNGLNSYFYNSTITSGSTACYGYRGSGIWEKCTLDRGSNKTIVYQESCHIFLGCTFTPDYSATGEGNATEKTDSNVLTLTVNDGTNPIEGAKCVLRHQYWDTYRNRWVSDITTHIGETDADGEVKLWGVYKTQYWKVGQRTIYWSSNETDEEGVSGSSEYHELIVTKDGYESDSTNTYYMDSNQSDTVSLTAITADITVCDIHTDATSYEDGDTVTLTGSITLNKATTDTAVKVEIRKDSDDSLVDTPLDTTYSFSADTATTINTINSSSDPTWTASISSTEDYYVLLTLTDSELTGSPYTQKEHFKGEVVTADLVDCDIHTDKPAYIDGDTVTITGSIKLNKATTDTTVKLEVYNDSDELQATPLNTTHSFTADTDTTINTINSSSDPTWSVDISSDDNYYVKLTLTDSEMTGSPITQKEAFRATVTAVGVPVVTNATLDDSAITERETVTFTCDGSNSPTDVWVEIGQARIVLSNTSGSSYSGTAYGWEIGVQSWTTSDITFFAVNSSGGAAPANSDTALTVSASDYSTMEEDIWDRIYARINAEVTDPQSGSRSNTKWIYASYPHEGFSDKNDYPAIIISPINTRTERKTFGKKRAHLSFTVDILSRSNAELDQLSDDVTYALQNYWKTFRGDYNFSNLEVDSTITNTFERGGIKVHLKSKSYSGWFGYSV